MRMGWMSVAGSVFRIRIRTRSVANPPGIDRPEGRSFAVLCFLRLL